MNAHVASQLEAQEDFQCLRPCANLCTRMLRSPVQKTGPRWRRTGLTVGQERNELRVRGIGLVMRSRSVGMDARLLTWRTKHERFMRGARRNVLRAPGMGRYPIGQAKFELVGREGTREVGGQPSRRRWDADWEENGGSSRCDVAWTEPVR